MLSRFFMYTDDVHAHMYTHVSYERPHMTYSIRHRRDLLAEAFWHRLPRCSCKSMTHFTPPPHFISPRLIFVLVVSVNSICRLISASLLPASWQMGNETFVFSFFFFFRKSATRSPIEEKVMTSRLIVESKRCIPITRSQIKCRNDQSLPINVQINHRSAMIERSVRILVVHG